MANYRKWLMTGLAGSMSLMVIACSGKAPTTPGLNTTDTPAITPIAPLVKDTPSIEEPSAEEPATKEPTPDPSATASPSDTTASPSPDPSATANPTVSPSPSDTKASPSPSPNPSATATPVPTSAPNPLGNETIDGFGDGKLNRPNAMTIAGGEVYITDWVTAWNGDESRVQVFGTDGTFRRTIVKPLGAALQTNLTGVAFANFKLYISNSNAWGGVETFSNNLFSQFGIGTKDKVAALATDSSGSLYVANTSDGCVSKFTGAGATQAYYFVNGVNAVGLSFDGENNLHVADATTNKIKVVTPAGTAKVTIDTGIATIGSLAVDKRNGDVYVIDRGRHEIKRFTSAGSVIQTIGASVVADPRGIAIDDLGTVMVTDGQYGGKKVIRFKPGK
ncbi:MAG: hypothetical protein H7338_07185 [Candidatus Sericytochromatia bacterium]|nr:hypothetical protein [Candidatus Sericytochromatia bacterium]